MTLTVEESMTQHMTADEARAAVATAREIVAIQDAYRAYVIVPGPMPTQPAHRLVCAAARRLLELITLKPDRAEELYRCHVIGDREIAIYRALAL